MTHDPCPSASHERVLARLSDTLRPVRIERPDVALITGELSFVGSRRRQRRRAPMRRLHRMRCRSLEIVASFGVGYDSVDASSCGEKGVMVTNTPDVLMEEVADTTLGLLLNTRARAIARRALAARRDAG